jgi:hypothetical protein
MGVDRSEHVMMGLFLKEVPFDYYEDEYLRYIEGWAEETLSIVPISSMSDEGYVIGRTIVQGDSDVGIELTEIKGDSIPTRAEVVKEILEKLKISAAEVEIKLYIFSHWC